MKEMKMMNAFSSNVKLPLIDHKFISKHRLLMLYRHTEYYMHVPLYTLIDSREDEFIHLFYQFFGFSLDAPCVSWVIHLIKLQCIYKELILIYLLIEAQSSSPVISISSKQKQLSIDFPLDLVINRWYNYGLCIILNNDDITSSWYCVKTIQPTGMMKTKDINISYINKSSLYN